MKITFIGGGNMGEAILAAVIAKGLSTPEEIIVSDTSEARCNYLKKEYRVMVTLDNIAGIENAEIVMLSVKPQVLPVVLRELNGKLSASQLVISIIAGTTVKTICDGLKHKRVVRSMPNTPAQIGEGMTVWTATPEVTVRQKKQAKAIIGTLGQEIYVYDEKYLDMATAVSGSGPAYVFYFIESLVEAAIKIGWSPESAERLAIQTLRGATGLLQQSGKKPADLRKAVTSPGGTTAAAIEQFEKGDYKKIIVQAVEAALNRAIELGK